MNVISFLAHLNQLQPIYLGPLQEVMQIFLLKQFKVFMKNHFQYITIDLQLQSPTSFISQESELIILLKSFRILILTVFFSLNVIQNAFEITFINISFIFNLGIVLKLGQLIDFETIFLAVKLL